MHMHYAFMYMPRHVMRHVFSVGPTLSHRLASSYELKLGTHAALLTRR